MDRTSERIEILSTSLLDTERTLVEEMRLVSRELGLGLGWHYLLDLSWAARQLQPWPGMQVLDAGAGIGVMQWWLAAQGVNVLSVDRSNRANLGPRFAGWCQILEEPPIASQLCGRRRIKALSRFLRPGSWRQWPRVLRSAVATIVTRRPTPPHGRGTITMYQRDLADMPDILDTSQDAVVAISALEHNEPAVLRAVVRELMRVIKPGGALIATLGAAREQDWFHEPSKGWCYTEATLRDLFSLTAGCSSNYERYDALFEELKRCNELKANLAGFYFKSGNNGMPWGIWDPKYQSVGVVKVKSSD